jgi:O-antigen/teichoic acid export membrane protein
MFDTLMLGFICDYDEVGYYVSATSISKVSLAVVTSLSAVAVPRVAYYAKEKDFKAINDLISKSIAVVSTLAFPMAVGLACISPTFVPLFLGETFRDAVWPTIIMSGVIIAIGYNNLTGSQILIGCGLDKSFLKCMLVGTISNFLLNLLMIPIWGASGAAASSVIAETLILITTIIHIKKYTPVKLNMASKDVLISILSSMLFIPVSIGLNHLLSGWELVISVIATCGMLYMLMQIFFKTQIYQMTYSFVRKKIHM